MFMEENKNLNYIHITYNIFMNSTYNYRNLAYNYRKLAYNIGI